jgi:hypothetical protein
MTVAGKLLKMIIDTNKPNPYGINTLVHTAR